MFGDAEIRGPVEYQLASIRYSDILSGEAVFNRFTTWLNELLLDKQMRDIPLRSSIGEKE